MRRAALLAAVAFTTACRAREPRAAASIAGDSIVLERAGCVGACPRYRLVVRGTGVVHFEGRDALAAVRDSGRVTTAQFSGLLDAFAAAGFARFAPRYVPGSPGCGLAAAGKPSATLILATLDTARRVEHSHGCSDAPEALARLEDRVDEITNSARWTGHALR